MTVHLYVRNVDGDMEEITEALDVTTLSVTENAEEGSVALSTVTLDDPEMVITMRGHRQIEIIEDAVYDGEDAIFRGFVADRTYSRGRLPLGREIAVQVSDPNTVWLRRVMVGSDCKRPAETDVARMQWLITTAEAGMIDDDTYLSTASPVNMDACDYRGQMMGSVADDCAQASGKNWWISHDFITGGGFQIWYGHEILETYSATASLSNLAAEIDGETVFAIADDTALRIDPSRVFAGVYLPFDGGAVYRQSGTTATAFAVRDTVMPSANVKTTTKATARAIRYLADLDEEDDRITTSVLVRSDQVNLIRPGMRVPFKASHLPGYGQFRWCRVLSRTVAYWAPGWYQLDLEISPGSTVESYTCSTAIAARETTTHGAIEDGALSISTTAPSTDGGRMYAFLLVTNRDGNAPTIAAPAGYTELFYTGATYESRSAYFIGYEDVAADEVATASTTYNVGFGADGAEVAGQFWLPFRGSIVQQKHSGFHHLYTDSTPTPGNVLLMFVKHEGSDDPSTIEPYTPGPVTGWTEVYNFYQFGDTGEVAIACFARCVAVGEGTAYGWTGGGGYSTSGATHVVELGL